MSTWQIPFILVSPDGSVGHVDIQQSDEKPFILVSPDGSVGHVDIQQSDEIPFILVSPDGSVGHVATWPILPSGETRMKGFSSLLYVNVADTTVR
jgi:hypothetical protein